MDTFYVYILWLHQSGQLHAREPKKKMSVPREGAGKIISVQDRLMKKDFLSNSDRSETVVPSLTHISMKKEIKISPKVKSKEEGPGFKPAWGQVWPPFLLIVQLPPPVQRHLVERQTDDS